jgi:DNA-binding MarR family transcriptional regulator
MSLLSGKYCTMDSDPAAATDALMALSRALVGLTTRALVGVDPDITLTQYRTLILLASNGPQRAADIAAELGVRPSSATRLCDRLVIRGLTRRQPGEADRRIVWIMLTDAGKDLIRKAMDRRRHLVSDLLSAVRPADGPAFVRAATSLAVAAGELPEDLWWHRWETSTHHVTQPA